MVLTCALSSQAETRAEFAERSVAKLEKTIDDLEGTAFTDFPITVHPYNTLKERATRGENIISCTGQPWDFGLSCFHIISSFKILERECQKYTLRYS